MTTVTPMGVWETTTRDRFICNIQGKMNICICYVPSTYIWIPHATQCLRYGGVNISVTFRACLKRPKRLVWKYRRGRDERAGMTAETPAGVWGTDVRDRVGGKA